MTWIKFFAVQASGNQMWPRGKKIVGLLNQTECAGIHKFRQEKWNRLVQLLA
jgi:hypothetical protein